MKIKATLSTEEGEVLDQFFVEPGPKTNSNAENEGMFATEVRNTLEYKFEVKDPS